MSVDRSPGFFTQKRIASYLVFVLVLFGLNVIGAVTTAPAANAVAPSLSLDPGNLSSYSGSGTSWNDISGNSLTLGASPSSRFPSYSTNNGGVFDFNAGLRQGTQSTTNFPASSTFTAEAWFNLKAFPSGDFTTIVTTQYYVGGAYGIIGPTLAVSNGGFLFGGFYDGGTWRWANASGYQLSLNNWYHAAVTWDGTYVRLYVNNSLQSTSASLAGIGTSSSRSAPIRIGTRWDMDGNSNYYVSGSIGVVKVYSTALTAAQISTDFTTDSSRYLCSTSTNTTATQTTVSFTNGGTCTWTAPAGVTSVRALIVGGGGGGGSWVGGGGGGGGVVDQNVTVTPGTAYPIVIGSGGAGATTTSANAIYLATVGSDSTALGLTAYGGGGGGTWNYLGSSRATGGGGSYNNTVASTYPAQGFSGGQDAYNGSYGFPTGGGGGAGDVGGTGTVTTNVSGQSGAGGAGKVSNITGSNISYGGGGGGGCHGNGITCYPGAGGSGGGGAGAGYVTGSSNLVVTGANGSANTGGGGGGAGAPNTNSSSVDSHGGNGGTGIVVFSYPTPPAITLTNSTISATTGTAVTSYSITNSGGAIASYSISPALTDSGLSFSTSTGLLSGTPLAVAATTTYTITAINTSGTSTATFNYSATLAACAPTNSSNAGYTIVTFTSVGSCSWTVPTGVTKADVLVVGGGGAGGTSSNGAGGGGGGGQVNAQPGTPISGSVSVQVASGGTPAVTAGTTPGGNGGTSSFTPTSGSAISASGGSGGASVAVSAVGSPSTTGFNGGGGSAWAGSLSPTNGSNGVGGYKGGASVGNSSVADPQAGGGGGGSGGNGANAGGTTGSYKGGDGGIGVSNSYVGSPTFYGGGGGGGKRIITSGGSAGVGGSGGGGAGGMQTAGTAGTANTGGGGGGGGGENNVLGGAGGSGVVILSYPISPASFGTASIAGTAQVGSVLTASSNTAAATSTTYQWQSSTSSGGTYSNISGATSNTYTPTTSDYNTYLKVAITVTNTSGTATQTSAATAVVAAKVITTANLGLTAPVTGATPVTSIADNGQYSATIIWSPAVTTTFAANTAYTAAVTIVPDSGYTVTGITANFFTSTSATVTNSAGTSAASAVYAATAKSVITTSNVTLTAPVTGATPVSSIADNGQYTAAITWSGTPATFGGATVYTATITLTADANYTLTGVTANFFTVNGNAATSGNSANAGVFTYVFSKTNPKITYSLNGGTGTLPTQAAVAPSNSFTLAAFTGFSRTNYTFAGWNDGSLTYAAGSNYTVGSTDITLTAIWVYTPTITTPISLSEGFTFYISNKSSMNTGTTYSATTSAGFVSVGATTGVGSTPAYVPFVVYGLAGGTNATVSVTLTTTAVGSQSSVTYTVTGSSSTASSTACTVTTTISGSKTFVTFTSTSATTDCVSTWTVPSGIISAEVAVVGGGAGGGYRGNASGGGGGAVLDHPTYALTPGSSIPIVVGGGGLSGTTHQGGGGPGVNGGNSSFNGVVASGGGGGAGGDSGLTMYFSTGFNGGSGGGGDMEGLPNGAGASNAASVCGCTTSGWSAFGNPGSGTSSGVSGGGAGASSGTGKTLATFSPLSNNVFGAGSGGGGVTTNAGHGGSVASAGTAGIVLISYVTAVTAITTQNVVLTAPVKGATPVTSIADNGQYTTAITWSGSPVTFASATVYTATITITPDSTSTLTGVSANFFTVNGNAATTGNLANAGTFTYTFPATASSVSTLASLTFTGANLNSTFVAGTLLYGAKMTSSSITITPTVTQANATIQYKLGSGGTLVTIASGATSAGISVTGGQILYIVSTAQDGTTTSTYQVTLYTNLASLSSISFSGVSISPTFASGTLSYTGTATTGTSSFTFTAAVLNVGLIVGLAPSSYNYNIAGSNFSFTNSTVTPTITLSYGSNVITINITAADAVTVTSYVFTINRTPPLPTVTSISSPSSASASTVGGQSITVSGTNLNYNPTVTVGGVSAVVTASAAGSVTFTSPALSAGAKTIVIVTDGGTAVTQLTLTYYAAPTITSLDVTSGSASGGKTVVITGTNFVTGQTTVTFGGAAATGITATTTSITLTTPAGTAGSVSVVVTTPGGSVALASGYTYVAVPVITSISPTSGAASGGTLVTVTGTNLTGATSVTVGGALGTSISNVSATSVTFTTPSGTAGARDVVLTTPGGSSTLTGAFTYIASPTVTAVSPTSGPLIGGTTITITGTNLTNASAVTFGGVAGSNIAVISSTSLTVVLPVNTAGQVDVQVTTPGGTSVTSAADKFTFAGGPTITSLSVVSGPLIGGITSTITGTNLAGTTNVTVGGTAATLGTITSTSVVITLPAKSAGAVDIVLTTPSGSVTSTGGFTYLPVPTITSLTVTSGPLGGGTSTVINGTDFTGTTSVTVNGVAATLGVITSTTVTITTPSGTAGSQSIVLTTPGGSTPFANAFTYVAAPTLGSASISGTAQVGSTLTATANTIGGTLPTTSYQWQIATTSAGTYSDIASATAPTYTAAATDAGNFIKVVITVTNVGGSVSKTSIATTAIATAAALTPTFSSITQTADGFTITITNYNVAYTWPAPTTTAGTVTAGTPSGSNLLLTVTGLNPGSSATITQTTTRTGYTSGTANATGIALNGASYTPTFGTPTATADGYTVSITNYDAAYSWSTPTVSVGFVSAGTPSGSTRILTVTGVNPSTLATITQIVTRTGYSSGSATVSGTSLVGAALTPQFGTPTPTATGFTVMITNYSSSYTWLAPSVSAGSVSVGTPVGSNQLLTVTALSPGSSATITVTNSRTGYTGGSATVSGTSLLSTDAKLSALTISSGTLSPVFSSLVTTYTVTVSNSTASVTITPTLNQINATVQAKVGSGTYSLLTSATASGALSLAIGANVVTIQVTAQDGSTTGTYILTVTRSASTDASLSGLTISAGTLTPTFTTLTTAYTVAEANSVSTVTVTPTANQAYATIQVKVGSGSYSTVSSGIATTPLTLVVGANTITVLVTAQDGSTTNTYSVVATRAPPSHGVSYNLGNGSGTIPTQSAVTENLTFQTAASTGLTYPGYTFNNWNDGITNYSAGATYTMSTANVVLTATWTATQQTVTYLAGTGGSGIAPTQTAVATAASFNTAANTFTRTGYDFAGWSDGTNTYLANVSYAMGINNVSLTATWTPKIYTVTYDANGATGSASRTSDSYTYGTSALNFPTAGSMTLTGYTFGGWSTTVGGSALTGTYTPTTSATLHAVWIPNIYTVSFTINGATGTTPTALSYTVGTTALTLPASTGLSYPGYDFGGWAITNAGPTIGATYTPTASITLQALWTPITYAITYNLNGGDVGSQPASGTGTIGNAFSVAAAPTWSAHYFAGWNDTLSTYAPGSSYTVSTHDIAFTALWIPIYTVHYNMNGSSTAAAGDQGYNSGTGITLPGIPVRDGYTFSGWLDQNNISHLASSLFSVIENSTLSAIWTAVPYTVRYSLNGPSGTAPSQSDVTVGSVFTLAAAPTWAGYTFNGWKDSSNTYGAGAQYRVGLTNISLTAQWSAINYTVTYDVNGASSTVPGALVKNVSQSFALPGAPTKNGWVFDTWGDGAATYLASANYTMPASNVVLTANYHAPTPTITSLSTTSGSVLGGTSSTITGTNFTLVTSVTVGGSVAVFTLNSDTSISIVTPAHSSGSADVVVTTTGGATTKSAGFTYSLLTQSLLALTTSTGTAGTAITLATTGGSGVGAVSFFTPTAGCSIVELGGVYYLNAIHPATCVVAATKASDSTYSQLTSATSVVFNKILSTVALTLPSNAIFASYNFTIALSAATNTPGSVSFKDDGTLIGTCSAVATSSNIASCNWTPALIKSGKVLTALFTPTNSTDYETATTTTLVNVVASSLSGLNPADLSQLGSLSALSNASVSQTFSTADTTIVLTVPANSLPSGSTVHLLLDTNGTSLQTLIGTGGYLLNSIVAWNAPDGSVPSASVPISLAITNAGIRKGMVVYGIIGGVSTPLGKAVTNGSVTVYLTEDPVIVVAPTVPDAPTSVLASNGQNQHSVVSWLAPSNDGGQPITGYTVTSSGGQSCQTTGALSCDVQNLLNGTAYTFTVIATNAVGPSAASSQSPSITPVGPPVIVTPISGLTTVYNRSYQLQLTASGSAPIQSYAVTSGSLPAGLSLNGSSGLISGAATATGSANIKITATDSNLQTTETALFTITVTPETPTATLALSPTTVASTGTAYTATVTPTVTTTSSSTTYTYSITDGTATGCAVTGTSSLTITANSAGTCLITATVAADSNYNAVTTSALTFTFTKKTNQTPIVQTVSGFINTPTTIDVVGSLGTGVLTFTTTSTGCTFGSGSSSNVLTATQSGNCLITVTNPGDTYYESSTATANISFGLTPLSVPTSISTTSSTGTSVSITFTGDTHGTTDLNVYVDATTITPLLTLHTFTSGDTVGNLTAGTTYYFTLTSIGNSNYSTSSPSARFSQATLPQAAQPVVSIAPSTSSITVGQSITLTATATTSDSGSLSYQWSNSGGIISGATLTTYTFTPASTSDAGSYSVTVTNTKNGTQTSNTASATVVIAGALSITTPASGLSGTVGPAFSVSVPAGGGATPLSYAITSGLADLTALGLQLDSSTAIAKIVGTPIVAGSANVVVTVTDANSQSASTASFTITIASATQTLAFTLSPNSAVSTGTAFTARVTPTVTNSGAGTGAITYAVSNGSASGCSIFSTSGIETITATSAGTCQIVATKAADSGYQSATSAPVTFTFTQATQSPLTITSGTTGTFGSPFTLTSSGGSGTGVVTYSASGTGCSINGSTLTVSVVTSCLITATNAGDLFYAPISSTAVSVNFGLASQTTPVVTSVSPNGSTTTLTVSYTVDSHGTSVTLTIYDTATAGSPIKTVTNFASGTSVTGLTAGTTYYVAVMSVGSSTYANSAQSLRVAGTTLTGATAPVIDVQPTATSILITVGQSETLTVTAHSNDGGALTYQWFRGADSLSGATSAQYSFHVDSSLQSAAYSVLITNSLNGTSASTTSNTISITVSVPIQIATPSTGLGATQGFAFSLGITASGGTSPLSYSVSTGAAALTSKGLTINPSTGVISGTPTETGTVTTAVTVTDAAGASATTGTFDITIVYDPDAPTPTFSAITQTATGFTVRVTNYDAAYTWSAAINLGSITNSIPSGSNWLLTVTGLTPGQSAAITVTASGVGFQPMSASITGAALGAPAPIPSSFFVKDSPVKISLTGNTFTFTAAKLRFSFHGGPLEPAVLSSQIINLMGNGTVLVSLTSIAETQTVTVDSIITGMTYTFQEVAAEKGLAESFDSHNFSVEYSMSLADRAAQQQQEKIYYAAVADVLAAHKKAVNQLTVAHDAVKKMSLIDYKIAMSALDLAWRNALVAASVNRQKAIYDLAVADAATLRAAGISIKVVDLFQPKSAPISGPTPAQIDTTTVATPAPTPTTPAKVPATSATPAPLTQVATIYFVQGSTELTTSSKAQLVALAASFVASKKTVVLAVGNSDLVPSSQNEKVSQQRSISVVRFLAKIAPKLSYIVRWNGSRKPAVSGTSQQANEKNRRVDIYSR